MSMRNILASLSKACSSYCVGVYGILPISFCISIQFELNPFKHDANVYNIDRSLLDSDAIQNSIMTVSAGDSCMCSIQNA